MGVHVIKFYQIFTNCDEQLRNILNVSVEGLLTIV